MGLAQEIVTDRSGSVYMDAHARIPQDEREVNGTSLDPAYPVGVSIRGIDSGYRFVIPIRDTHPG